MQVNYIEVLLKKPIPIGSKKKISIEYEGYLLCYIDTGMLYIKDHIDPYFTVIRPACHSNFKNRFNSGFLMSGFLQPLTVITFSKIFP